MSADKAGGAEPLNNDYDDFLDSGPDSGDSEAAAGDTITPGIDIDPDRPKPGRPEGQTDARARLERALRVKLPDVNIQGGLRWIVKRFGRKKDIQEELIKETAHAYTQAAEFAGILNKVRNTPVFLFGRAALCTYKLITYYWSNDEPTSADSDGIRQAGDGQEQPGAEPIAAV